MWDIMHGLCLSGPRLSHSLQYFHQFRSYYDYIIFLFTTLRTDFSSSRRVNNRIVLLPAVSFPPSQSSCQYLLRKMRRWERGLAKTEKSQKSYFLVTGLKTELKEFLGRYPAWVDSAAFRSQRSVNCAGGEILPYELIRGSLESPKTKQVTPIDLGCPWELDDKTLLLKKLHIWLFDIGKSSQN